MSAYYNHLNKHQSTSVGQEANTKSVDSREKVAIKGKRGRKRKVLTVQLQGSKPAAKRGRKKKNAKEEPYAEYEEKKRYAGDDGRYATSIEKRYERDDYATRCAEEYREGHCSEYRCEDDATSDYTRGSQECAGGRDYVRGCSIADSMIRSDSINYERVDNNRLSYSNERTMGDMAYSSYEKEEWLDGGMRNACLEREEMQRSYGEYEAGERIRRGNSNICVERYAENESASTAEGPYTHPGRCSINENVLHNEQLYAHQEQYLRNKRAFDAGGLRQQHEVYSERGSVPNAERPYRYLDRHPVDEKICNVAFEGNAQNQCHERYSMNDRVSTTGGPNQYYERCPTWNMRNRDYYSQNDGLLYHHVGNDSRFYHSVSPSFNGDVSCNTEYQINEQSHNTNRILNVHERFYRDNSCEMESRPSEDYTASHYHEDADSLCTNDFQSFSERYGTNTWSRKKMLHRRGRPRRPSPGNTRATSRSTARTAKSIAHAYNYLKDEMPKFSATNELYKPREGMDSNTLKDEQGCDSSDVCGQACENKADVSDYNGQYANETVNETEFYTSERCDSTYAKDYVSFNDAYASTSSVPEYHSARNDTYNNPLCPVNQEAAVRYGAFQCVRCKFYFKRLSTLKIHMISHLKRADFFGCTRCDSAYKTYSLLKKHGLKEHKERIFDVNHSELRIFVAFLSIFSDFYNPFVDSFCFNCFTYPKSLKLHPCKGKYFSEKKCMLCGDKMKDIKEHILNGACKSKVKYEFK
ncbi:Zn-finger [Trachipleistophora hominis]|uniref:Zn-finger n=1 Tax=Trachipleistophora hominis TaxID=72359 RepID=L7JSA3_TRAHO|nr:Zn-finger [Trachipleistophora hominis]